MNRLFIFVVFAVFLHGSSGESWDFSNPTSVLFDFEDTCTAPGLMCKSCEELVQCVETTSGHFETIPLQYCNASIGITCLKKQCSNETNPRCNNQEVPPFVCSSTGVFPDPYDCKRYHMCALPEDAINGTKIPIDLKCTDNYGYDPVSTYCKVALKDGVCPDAPPIPPCKIAGENAAIAGTSIYYICLFDNNVLLPHLYMCPHGKKYVNYKCT